MAKLFRLTALTCPVSWWHLSHGRALGLSFGHVQTSSLLPLHHSGENSDFHYSTTKDTGHFSFQKQNAELPDTRTQTTPAITNSHGCGKNTGDWWKEAICQSICCKGLYFSCPSRSRQRAENMKRQPIQVKRIERSEESI